MNPDVFDCKLKTPCTILLIGKTSSGKSELILNIIDKRDQIFDRKVEQIYYVYKSYQDKFDEFLKYHPEVNFLPTHTDLPDLNGKHTLIVFDDKMLVSEECNYITDIFIRLSHHSNITSLVTLQSVFAKNLRCVSINATYHILFPNHRDKSSIDYLNRQICPTKN